MTLSPELFPRAPADRITFDNVARHDVQVYAVQQQDVVDDEGQFGSLAVEVQFASLVVLA